MDGKIEALGENGAPVLYFDHRNPTYRLNRQFRFPVCCYYFTVEGLSSVVDASQEISL